MVSLNSFSYYILVFKCVHNLLWVYIFVGQFGYPNAIPDTPNSSSISMSGQNMIEMALRLPPGYLNYLANERATRNVGVQTRCKCVCSCVHVCLNAGVCVYLCICILVSPSPRSCVYDKHHIFVPTSLRCIYMYASYVTLLLHLNGKYVYLSSTHTVGCTL